MASTGLPNLVVARGQQQQQQPQRTFTFFPSLPAELRSRIWDIVIMEPHNVIIIPEWERQLPIFSFYCDRMVVAYQNKLISTFPALLHCNRESRAECLKHYSLDFGYENSATKNGRSWKYSSEPRVYINWALDRICLMFPRGLDTIGSDLLKDLQRRCISNNLKYIAFNMMEMEVSDVLSFCSNITSLKEVILYHCSLSFSRTIEESGSTQIEFKEIDEGSISIFARGRRTQSSTSIQDARRERDEIFEMLNRPRQDDAVDRDTDEAYMDQPDMDEADTGMHNTNSNDGLNGEENHTDVSLMRLCHNGEDSNFRYYEVRRPDRGGRQDGE